ncbi:MAG: hypothetical protein G01um1014107_265 [Parcubacteria group bacterium Gr01-1014_107]|nr:MAG: hypothetical protein G01um1014107_265 [Parcubacteria group bacterium Gr01-1014_107]
MVELIQIVLGTFGLWNVREFRRARDSLIMSVATVLVFIIPGAFLGGWSWMAKVIWMEIGLVAIAIHSLYLAYHRAAFGAEIGVAVEIAYGTGRGGNWLRGVAFTGVEGGLRYVRFIAALLASELAAGLAVLWLPAHRDPVMALLLLPAIMIFVTYAVWKKGELWWPEFTQFIAAFTLVVSLVAILVPDIATELSSRLGGFQDGFVAVIRGTPSTIAAFWIFGLLALLSLVAYRMARLAEQPLVRIIAGMVLPILLVMLLIQYFVWGAGQKTVADAGTPITDPVVDAILTGKPVPHGKYFNVNAGQTVPVTFHKEGFYVMSGRGWVESPVAVKGTGQGQRKFFQDANKHSSEHGGRAPCYYDQESQEFQFTFQAEEDMIILTRAAGSRPCR